MIKADGINQGGLLTLYSYNAYANRLLLDTVGRLSPEQLEQDCSPSHNTVHQLLVHILDCEAFFLVSCQNRDLIKWGETRPTILEIRERWHILEQAQQSYLSELEEGELARMVEIHPRGRALHFSVRQLLLQAVIHSIHHRGELSIVLSGLGFPLPTLDILLHFIQESGQSWD